MRVRCRAGERNSSVKGEILVGCFGVLSVYCLVTTSHIPEGEGGAQGSCTQGGGTHAMVTGADTQGGGPLITRSSTSRTVLVPNGFGLPCCRPRLLHVSHVESAPLQRRPSHWRPLRVPGCGSSRFHLPLLQLAVAFHLHVSPQFPLSVRPLLSLWVAVFVRIRAIVCLCVCSSVCAVTL